MGTFVNIESVASLLHQAETSRIPIPPLSVTFPEINENDAYAIQLCSAKQRREHRDSLTGFKIGLTSREAQKHFGVFKPDFGHLFASMAVLDQGTVSLASLIQPKIEAEMAFVLGRDLKGPGITLREVTSSIDCVVAALEIIDSRIENWKISASDTIADNGSSARYVLGKKRERLDALDLSLLGMALSQNSEVLVTAAGSAVMGNPLMALVFLVNELGEKGLTLEAGQVILSGSLGGMLTMRSGDTFLCEIQDLGQLSVECIA